MWLEITGLHIYINPFATLTRHLQQAIEQNDPFAHGSLTYDPLNPDPPMGCDCQFIFLLNSLSQYRDFATLGRLSALQVPATWLDIWALGGVGPYGFFHDPLLKVEFGFIKSKQPLSSAGTAWWIQLWCLLFTFYYGLC